MDLSHKGVTEDSKYAFLLGSALRNEDPEQLLTVYDNLIPQAVSASRLEHIKENARHIAELPELEFNALVLNARNYTLALGRSSMNQASGGSPLPGAENEECVQSSTKFDGKGMNHVIYTKEAKDLCNSLAPSLFSKAHRTPPDSLNVKIDIELHGASADDDSELPDSSYKVPSLKNSRSCSDSTYGDSEEDRPGSFDYMPEQSHIRITHAFNPPYDEEVKLDSSTEGSSIESPRSETSVTHDEYNLAEEGTEMSTLSYTETPQPVVREHAHSDDCWDYMNCGKRSDDEVMEDEEDERERLLRSRSMTSYVSSLTRAVPSQVDEGISYGLKQLGVSGSEHPNRRMTFTSYNPYTEQYKSEDNREEDDRKSTKTDADILKDTKSSHLGDDSDKPEVSGLVDVNGNPRSLEAANNSQMRQLLRGKSENTAPGSLASYSPSAITQSYSSSSTDSNILDRKKERKRMKLERQKWMSADAYQDHKKFNDIKEILDFVEGPHSSSKTEGKSAKKKQERSKKKDHPLNGHDAIEDSAAGEDGPDLMENVVVMTTAKPHSEAMGNSSGKSLGENNIIPKTWSHEDTFDKNSEFYDCLNTLPAELVISDNIVQKQQNDTTENTKRASKAGEVELCSTKGINIDTHLTDNNKLQNKKLTKPKSKKEKQEPITDNGPVNTKANIMKPKESVDLKESLLLQYVSADGSRNIHHSTEVELHTEVKREDSFTEVKKRKKRPGGKDLNTVSTNRFSSSAYKSHSINGHPQRSNPRPHTIIPPPPAGGFITVIGSSNSLPVNDQPHLSRDLSPSAFPVLAGHGPVTLQAENRRNSCGDINADSLENKTYDSDRESAKSLPNARGTRIGGDISPIYPVSYARIAAAPRRNDNTHSPSSESGVASGSQNSSVNSSVTHTPGSSIDIMSPQSPSNTTVISERKATVWKGSPRERRHSIGSSPEDNVEKEKTSVAQRNRQCGSQEVLSKDIVTSVRAASEDVATASSLSFKVIQHSGSSNSLQSDTDLLEGTVEPVVKLDLNQLENTDYSAETDPRAKTQKMSTLSEYAVSHINSSHPSGGSSIVSCQPNKQIMATASAEVKEKVDLEPNCSNVTTSDLNRAKPVTLSTLPTKGNPAGDSSVKTVPNKPKVVSGPQVIQKISSGTNNTKSVIFLDKRFGASPPQNLGITFGFDSSFESINETASQLTNSQLQPSLPSQPHISVAASSSSLQCCTTSSAVQLFYSPTHSNIPPAVQTAIASSNHTLVISSSQSSDNNPVPKGPHIQGLCNGLIHPSSSAANNTILQGNIASSSINNDNNNTNLASSNRTSCSKLQQEAQFSHSINPQVMSDPLVLPGLPSISSAVLENSTTLTQVNKSIPHTVTGNIPVTFTRANPMGVTYSPNHPPPPLPQGLVKVTRDKDSTNNSASVLPSTQEGQESTHEIVSVPGSTKFTQVGRVISPVPPIKAGSTMDIVEIPGDNTTASHLPPITEAALQKQHCMAEPETALHVVYGEKIKPVTGCGRLMFVPYYISQNKGNFSEAASFLRKKWFEDVTQKRSSSAFVTINDD